MKKTKSTFILSCRSRLVEYFLEMGFLIIQHKSKHLSSITNEARQIIHDIHIQKQFYYVLLHNNFLCSKHHKEIPYSV